MRRWGRGIAWRRGRPREVSTARPAHARQARHVHVARRAVESCGLVMAVAWSVIANPVCLKALLLVKPYSIVRSQSHAASHLAHFRDRLRRVGRQATLTQGGERARAHDPTAYTRVQSTLRPSPPLDPVLLCILLRGPPPPRCSSPHTHTAHFASHLGPHADAPATATAARAPHPGRPRVACTPRPRWRLSAGGGG